MKIIIPSTFLFLSNLFNPSLEKKNSFGKATGGDQSDPPPNLSRSNIVLVLELQIIIQINTLLILFLIYPSSILIMPKKLLLREDINKTHDVLQV